MSGKKIFCRTLVAVLLTIFCAAAFADEIELVDGRTLKGKILKETATTVEIEIYTNLGAIRERIERSKIRSIVRTAPDEGPVDFKKVIDEARGLYEQGKFAQALEKLESLGDKIDSQAARESALWIKARACEELGRWVDARAFWTDLKQSARDPRRKFEAETRATVYAKYFQDTIRDFSNQLKAGIREVAQQIGQNIEELWRDGKTLLEASEFERAQEKFNTALARCREAEWLEPGAVDKLKEKLAVDIVECRKKTFHLVQTQYREMTALVGTLIENRARKEGEAAALRDKIKAFGEKLDAEAAGLKELLLLKEKAAESVRATLAEIEKQTGELDEYRREIGKKMRELQSLVLDDQKIRILKTQIESLLAELTRIKDGDKTLTEIDTALAENKGKGVTVITKDGRAHRGAIVSEERDRIKLRIGGTERTILQIDISDIRRDADDILRLDKNQKSALQTKANNYLARIKKAEQDVKNCIKEAEKFPDYLAEALTKLRAELAWLELETAKIREKIDAINDAKRY